MTEGLTLHVSDDEALVLFELLSRFTAGGSETAFAVEHPAEAVVLWNLCGELEKLMTQPFRADYVELLANARQRLGSGKGSGQ